ncbi:MAG: hypothetical protein LBN93_05945 [Candidatus Symbiothrix sp.]|jgi:hypothetical protein|nr:hypothetical protein [Candidatus Symbiothrix sp.]
MLHRVFGDDNGGVISFIPLGMIPAPPTPLKGEMVAYLRHAGMVDEHCFLPSYYSYRNAENKQIKFIKLQTNEKNKISYGIAGQARNDIIIAADLLRNDIIIGADYIRDDTVRDNLLVGNW